MARVLGECVPPVRTKYLSELKLKLTGSLMKIRFGHAAIMARCPPLRVYFDSGDVGSFGL
jgi:hypothetical protein